MATNSQELIRQLKETKKGKKITYTAIMEAMKVNGSPALSMTTLRRVFANGSENRASTFNYEETLLPIAEAIKTINGGTDDSPEAKEIEGLKTALSLQNEELDRLIELKDQLTANVSFMTEQIAEKDAMIKRLMDRLDQKDEIIGQFITDTKLKDEIIRRAMEKCI